jgi:DNA-binding HxlR family transcriptional regulator
VAAAEEWGGAVLNYGQFCPVAQAAQVFADRWTPLILRELCFGACTFGDLLQALPLISRTMLTQRLKELAAADVVLIEPKARGRGHLYRLTDAGEDFRPLIEMLSLWGQRRAQTRLSPDDLHPGLLMFGMQRQVDPAEIPSGRTVVRFEFRGLPKGCRGQAYWWYVIQRPEIDVCLKDPGFEVDAVVRADLGAFTRLCLGYLGLDEEVSQGRVAFHGSGPAIALLSQLLRLPKQPTLKQFRYAPFPKPQETSDEAHRAPAELAAG